MKYCDDPRTTLCSYPQLTWCVHCMDCSYCFSSQFGCFQLHLNTPLLATVCPHSHNLIFGIPLHLLHLIFAWLDLGETSRKQEDMPLLSFLSNGGSTWFNLAEKHASLWGRKSEIKEEGLATGASSNSALLVQAACCIATSSGRHPVKEQYFPCNEEPSCARRRPRVQWSSQL